MSVTSGVGMVLTMFHTNADKALVTMKAKRYEPFVAYVKDFNFDEDETKVIFQRCDQTVFPTDTPEEKPETYMTYIKNIKNAALHDA